MRIRRSEETVRVLVEGLRKPGKRRAKRYEVVLIVKKDTPLTCIWDKLDELGYLPPYKLRDNTRIWGRLSNHRSFRPSKQVQIVDDKSAADDTHLHLNEPLAACLNRDQDVQLEIISPDAGDYESLHSNSLGIDGHLTILFHRTVRMPDDNRLHHLPSSLGAFPLYNVADYADRLPPHILDKGGVFLPMWQREALWMSFHTAQKHAYALRLYVGHINAVSGDSMIEKRWISPQMGVSDKELDSVQDYVVVPGQHWVDGICISPGVVRQFVAMPLGSGYTVEGQKTGEEKHGGLQIEITPAYRSGLAKWLIEETDAALDDQSLFLDDTKTPVELGLKPGQRIRSYPPDPIYTRPSVVADLARPSRRGNADAILTEALYLDSDRYDPIRYNRGGPVREGGRVGAQPRSSTSRSFLSLDTPEAPHSPSAGSRGQNEFETTSRTRYESLDDPGNDFVRTQTSSSHDTGRRERERKPHSRSLGPPEWNSRSPPRSSRQVNNLRSFSEEYPEEGIAERSPSIPRESEIGMQRRQEKQPVDAKAMGLAAGGKLIQDIYRDPHPPTIWNVAAARVIHIHTLDPESCERVTHIVPPPVPMEAYEYISAKLPFFVVEEQINNRLSGGDFDNVKSVSQMDEIKGINSEPTFDPSLPTMCKNCEKRLCDCIVRPCNHMFCNVCIRELEDTMVSSGGLVKDYGPCPQCRRTVSHVAGFMAPMNLPGEESIRTKMPVHILKVNDGRIQFESVRRTRV